MRKEDISIIGKYNNLHNSIILYVEVLKGSDIFKLVFDTWNIVKN